MKKINNLTLILALCFASLLSGCNFNSVYDKAFNIPQNKWSKNDTIVFEVPVTDTIHAYNILISLRNNNNYPYSNCFLFIHTISPKGLTICDTIQFRLANDRGKWLGHGFGGVWSSQYYKKNIRFPVVGVYRIKVVQGMRDEPLEGIMDVSLRVEKMKP